MDWGWYRTHGLFWASVHFNYLVSVDFLVLVRIIQLSGRIDLLTQVALGLKFCLVMVSCCGVGRYGS